MRFRDVVAALGDTPGTGSTQADEARQGYLLLERAIDALGGSTRAIAAQDRDSYALFDWAAALAPHLLPYLSGHVKLTVAAIEELGDGSRYQHSCLQELDSGRTVGVAMVTELGHGTDAFNMETTATWQPRERAYRLNSPTPASVKFMPNVAATGVPKTVIVIARLIVNGTDEGVWPFLLPLRTVEGLVDGVDVAALPDNGYGLAMDNAETRFDGAVVPESGLLGGDVAWFDEQGRFHCELTAAQRFARTMSPLTPARLCMGGAAVSAARAGLALTIGYASRRVIRATGATMLSSDHVAQHLVGAMADVWAMTCLVNSVRSQCEDAGAEESALWAMLVKPVASRTAWESLEVCRQRTAAQGMLRANYLTDWISLCQGTLTAEGENWAMLGAAGRAIRRSGVPTLTNSIPGNGARAWWHQLLAKRERLLLVGIEMWGHPDSNAIDLATAVTDRVTVDAMITAAKATNDTATQQILTDLAEVYALRRVRAHGVWFAANGALPDDRAALIEAELSGLVDDVAPHLPVLAQSFALPDDMPAPIAGDYLTWWTKYAGWPQTRPAGGSVAHEPGQQLSSSVLSRNATTRREETTDATVRKLAKSAGSGACTRQVRTEPI